VLEPYHLRPRMLGVSIPTEIFSLQTISNVCTRMHLNGIENAIIHLSEDEYNGLFSIIFICHALKIPIQEASNVLFLFISHRL
jgi:hypothetical protein